MNYYSNQNSLMSKASSNIQSQSIEEARNSESEEDQEITKNNNFANQLNNNGMMNPLKSSNFSENFDSTRKTISQHNNHVNLNG